MHDAQDVFYVALVQSAFAGKRIDAVVGESCGHDGKITRADQD
jgi:hypothetical protein